MKTTSNNKPDRTCLDEMLTMVGISRPNVLLKAANDAVDVALDHIAAWISPLHICNLPGPATLPEEARGAVLLRDVGALDAEQQSHMIDWLDKNAGNVQVISATETDLFAAVESGTFSEKLYYRLNMMLAEIGLVNEEESWVV